MIHLPLEKTYGPFRTELNKFRIEAFCEVVGMAPTASVPISYLAMLAWASTTGRPRASVSTTVVASGLAMVVVVVSLDPELSPHAVRPVAASPISAIFLKNRWCCITGETTCLGIDVREPCEVAEPLRNP